MISPANWLGNMKFVGEVQVLENVKQGVYFSSARPCVFPKKGKGFMAKNAGLPAVVIATVPPANGTQKMFKAELSLHFAMTNKAEVSVMFANDPSWYC